MDAVKIEGLTKKYINAAAVDNLFLTVRKGELFSLDKLSITSRIGLPIEIITGLIILILLFFNQIIPDVVVWIYCVGVAITFIGLFTNTKIKQ